jgi:hypothetical protein
MVRIGGGVLVLGFGVAGLARAAAGAQAHAGGWIDFLCVAARGSA